MKRTPLKRGKPLNKVSKTHKKAKSEYMKLNKEYLKQNPYCEMCYGSLASQIHHRRGRGKLLCAVQYFMGVCQECHSWIHAHPRECYENGLLIIK